VYSIVVITAQVLFEACLDSFVNVGVPVITAFSYYSSDRQYDHKRVWFQIIMGELLSMNPEK
jgi:hypothetical protein